MKSWRHIIELFALLFKMFAKSNRKLNVLANIEDVPEIEMILFKIEEIRILIPRLSSTGMVHYTPPTSLYCLLQD